MSSSLAPVLSLAMSADLQSQVLPFKATEKTLRQRPQGDRGAHRLPEHRVRADPGADGLAQRGRAGQVGLRPLLRAHDVPRHAGLSAREVPGGHDRGRARARTPTPPTTSRTTTSPSPRRTWRRSSSSRPTASRTSSYAEAAFKTEARAVLGEYNKNSANPVHKLIEVQREHAFTTHTYKHTTMGFLKDIEDMPNQFEYAKTFFDRWYRPENTDDHRGRRRRPRSRSSPLVEKYWGGWKRGTLHRSTIPPEPAPQGPGLRARALADADAALGRPSPSTARPSRRRRRTSRPSTCSRPRLRPDLRPVQAPGGGRAEGRPALPLRARRTSIPYLVTVAARVKKPEDAVYVRDADPGDLRRACARSRCPRRARGGREVERALRPRSAASTTPSASPPPSRASCATARSFDTLNDVLPRATTSLTPEDLQAAARKYFTDAGPRGDDAVAATRCPRGSTARRRSSSLVRGRRAAAAPAKVVQVSRPRCRSST